jgi:hypothetical protein
VSVGDTLAVARMTLTDGKFNPAVIDEIDRA